MCEHAIFASIVFNYCRKPAQQCQPKQRSIHQNYMISEKGYRSIENHCNEMDQKKDLLVHVAEGVVRITAGKQC